jgi:DNA repair exonuclease SbcCD ATPase subunit
VIRSIRVTNWRAYESLELDLERPVTFFVAPNGIGKTSLVEAVRWGLLGTPHDRNRGRVVRAGRDLASVHLDVTLPTSIELSVRRELKRTGAASFQATANGEEVDEGRYMALLTDAWAADAGLLDALIFGPAQTSKSGGFPLRDHLAQILGVTQLLDAAETIKARRAEISDRIKSLRADLSGTDEAILGAEEAIRSTETDIDEARTTRAQAAENLQIVEARAAAAAAWERYRAEVSDYQVRLRDLVAEMSSALAVSDGEPAAALAGAERDATNALNAGVQAITEARLRAAGSASAVELLSEDTGLCPTCLRPLTASERSAALAAHGHEQAGSHDEVEARERETAVARERLEAIARFRQALSALRVPTEPDEPDPGTQDEAAVATARQQLAEMSERLGALSGRLERAQQELASLRQAAADQVTLVAIEQEDVVLSIAQRALTTVATRYMADRVEPMTHEVANRWKLVFGAEGLHLDADGVLTLAHGDVDLALHEFSGGERSTALLVTRLLLAASATRVSTMWFDEPLEHLDPRRRAAVAQTIVRAAQLGAVGQVVVTTYEEEIARRLEGTAPTDVQLTYARKQVAG